MARIAKHSHLPGDGHHGAATPSEPPRKAPPAPLSISTA